MHRIFASLILLCATFVVSPPAALAGPITVPSGLNPGDQYRLVFVTSTSRTANSTFIDDYNAFVTAVANSQPALVALGTTWKAIASTQATDARDNTSTNPHASVGLPIYSVGGELVATSNSDLWDGTIAHAIGYGEAGSLIGLVSVWTGTGSDGTTSSPLGAFTGLSTFGVDFVTDGRWIGLGNGTQDSSIPLYAISGVLTATPEPSTMVLACLAVAGLAVTSLRRHRQCKT